jgi:hypothetical protein
MSFNSDTTDYKTIHERLEARKVNDIVIQMKELFIFNLQSSIIEKDEADH